VIISIIRKTFINFLAVIGLIMLTGVLSYAEHKDDHSKGKPPKAEVELPEVSNCDDNPVITENGEFEVELLAVELDENLVTFIYSICKQDPRVKDLGHWVLALDHFEPFLGSGKTFSDLVVECGFDGEGENGCGETRPDPTTQIQGIKFEFDDDDGDDASPCRIVSVTLDKTALAPGLIIDIGCVLSSTKAGNQDIRKEGRPSPGYASVQGPIASSLVDDIHLLFESSINSDQEVYAVGDPMDVFLNINNHGVDAIADIFVGLVCPFGRIFCINGPQITQGSFSDLSTLVPFAAGVDLINPFIVDNSHIIAHIWNGNVPAGQYTLFVALVQPDAWDDGSNDPDDILLLNQSTLIFIGEPE